MASIRIVAAFDFDGTITTSDSLREFVRYAVGNVGFVAGVIRAALSLVGALLGTCDRGTTKAHFLTATIGGMRESELRDAAQRYVKGQLTALIRPEMVERVREHQRHGHEIVLVSASPALYLELWAAQLGFDAVLATELEFRDGRCTGCLVLLCHKFNLTSQQHGQRGSLLVMARAMSIRNVEIESGTCRWTRWAASRNVTFG